MSQLMNANGSVKAYALVDADARTVVAAFNYVGNSTDKAIKAHQKDYPGKLTLHNLTHPKIPDWLKAYIHSDRAYCARRAQDMEARGASLRRKAAKLITEAEEFESYAAQWRKRSEAAAQC